MLGVSLLTASLRGCYNKYLLKKNGEVCDPWVVISGFRRATVPSIWRSCLIASTPRVARCRFYRYRQPRLSSWARGTWEIGRAWTRPWACTCLQMPGSPGDRWIIQTFSYLVCFCVLKRMCSTLLFIKNKHIDRPLEMTSRARPKCRNLCYAIMYNVILANQMTESFEYHWFRPLAMFKVTSFPAILSIH